jgi:hypothetical protein
MSRRTALKQTWNDDEVARLGSFTTADKYRGTPWKRVHLNSLPAIAAAYDPGNHANDLNSISKWEGDRPSLRSPGTHAITVLVGGRYTDWFPSRQRTDITALQIEVITLIGDLRWRSRSGGASRVA